MRDSIFFVMVFENFMSGEFAEFQILRYNGSLLQCRLGIIDEQDTLE